MRISEQIGQGFRSNSDTESETNSDADFGLISDSRFGINSDSFWAAPNSVSEMRPGVSRRSGVTRDERPEGSGSDERITLYGTTTYIYASNQRSHSSALSTQALRARGGSQYGIAHQYGSRLLAPRRRRRSELAVA